MSDQSNNTEQVAEAFQTVARNSSIGCVVPVAVLVVAFIGNRLNLSGGLMLLLVLGTITLTFGFVFFGVIRNAQKEQRRYFERRTKQEDDH